MLLAKCHGCMKAQGYKYNFYESNLPPMVYSIFPWICMQAFRHLEFQSESCTCELVPLPIPVHNDLGSCAYFSQRPLVTWHYTKSNNKFLMRSYDPCHLGLTRFYIDGLWSIARHAASLFLVLAHVMKGHG